MRMKLIAGAAVSALMAAPAFADVDLRADVDLDKDVNISERIDTNVRVQLDLDVISNPAKFAEAISLANQQVSNNEGCGNCAEKSDLITGSALNNVGMTSINQAVGNFNNQGTLVSAAVDIDGGLTPPDDTPDDSDDNPPATDAGFAEATSAADQRIGTDTGFSGGGERGNNFPDAGNRINSVNILFRDATIDGSFNGNEGLTYGNQSAGNANNQLNTLTLAFSLAEDGGVALSDSELGQANANNFVGESTQNDSPFDEAANVGINKAATMSGSMNGNIGITGVNQSVGNFANQANIVSVAAVGSGLPTFN